MRALIGTLYSGENELDECINSIKNQTYTNYEHIILRNLPNREAHHTLFQTFLSRQNEFEVLIKVDADMVLCSDRLFENIEQKMTKCLSLEVFSIAVKDFFSGESINGLNTYRNTVRWDFSKDTMFVDIPETSLNHLEYDSRVLAPAAIHCKNPSPLQAFHYGIHRGLKSIQQQHSTTHWALLEKTWRNFLRVKDIRIGLAVLGAELVYAGVFTRLDVDYTNPRINDELQKYMGFDRSSVQKEIIRLKIENWGFLPMNLRRRVIRRIRGKKA